MANKFKAGDRVVMYGHYGRLKGTVTNMTAKTHTTGRIVVSTGGQNIEVFPQQCRHLKPRKPKRRVWIHPWDVPTKDKWKVAAAAISGNYEEGHVEFVEVRRRKAKS